MNHESILKENYYYKQLVEKLQKGGMSLESAHEIADKLDEPLCSGLLRSIGELCFQATEQTNSNH